MQPVVVDIDALVVVTYAKIGCRRGERRVVIEITPMLRNWAAEDEVAMPLSLHASPGRAYGYGLFFLVLMSDCTACYLFCSPS